MDTRVLRNSEILQNGNVPTWGTFNSSLTRPWNANEWEYVVTGTLDVPLDSSTPNVVVTTTLDQVSNIEDEGDYIAETNLTTTTYQVSTTSSVDDFKLQSSKTTTYVPHSLCVMMSVVPPSIIIVTLTHSLTRTP